MSIELGVIADDLTGGMMVASLLEREGVNCPLVTSITELNHLDPDVEAVVVARKIRLVPAAEARDEVAQAAKALLGAGTRQLYYKYCATFDSTNEGNIGPCGEALMAATGAEQMIFCPAFPEYSVTVFQGRMFLGRFLLSETFKRHDPVTSMKDANLVTVLQGQTQEKVGLISHQILNQDTGAAIRTVKDQVAKGIRFFVVDAANDNDLVHCARLVQDWPALTGADAMPVFLARAWRQRNNAGKARAAAELPGVTGHEVVLAGSCADATLRQLDHFEARQPLFRIDLLEATSDEDAMVARALTWAKTRIGKGPIGVSSSANPETVARIQAVIGRDGAARLAERILGKVAAGLYSQGARRFVVAGGETSGQVINSLNIKRVRVASFDDLGGGYCYAEAPEPMSILLKAGGLGSPDLFFRGFERMQMAKRPGETNVK